MPKKQDWLDIIEQAAELKKGTKFPKNVDIYSITAMLNPPSQRANGMNMNPSMYTGAGEDGIVQPEKPVALDKATNPPSVYHEGEEVKFFPGGKQIIPAKTEGEQRDLSMLQKKENLPGFATGGTVYDDPYSLAGGSSTRPTNTIDTTPQSNMFKSGVNQAFKTTQQRAAGADPLMENITNRALQAYDQRAAVSDTSTRQSLASQPYLTEGAKRAVTAKQGATYRAGLSDLTGDLSQQSMQRAEAANTELYNMGRTGVQDEQNRQQFEKTFGEQQYQSDVSRSQWDQSFSLEKQKYGDQEFARMADDAQTTSLDSWLAKYPNATKQDYDIAREFKTRQLQGMDVANATASENLTQLQKSDKWNDAQAFLNAGDFENYAALVKQITGRDINTTQFEEDRKYVTDMRNLSIDAQKVSNDAARLGVSGDALAIFVQAVNSGADLDAANQASGLNLTQEQWIGMRAKYASEMRTQAILQDTAEVQNDAARIGVGTDQMAAFVYAINNGASLDAANAASGLNLTQDDWFEMRAKYSLGLRQDAVTMNTAEIQNSAARLGINADRLNTFISAVNGGADLAAANEASGLDLTRDQFESIAKQYSQAIIGNEIALDSARTALGDSIYESIATMIGNGSTLSAVNQRLREEGKRPINESEYSAMRAVSGVGQQEWERNMQAIDMLLQTQDPKNIEQAATKLGEQFPGVTFDFTQLINDVGADRFADNMSTLATLSNTFDTWGEARDSVEGLNLMSQLTGTGMREVDVINMFQNLKVNAIDEQWSAIENSDWFGNLTNTDPDTANMVRETFTKGLTGELEFDIQPVFNIMDSNGDFVKSFGSAEDANKFLGENADKNYTMNRDSNYIYKDLVNGDTITVNNGTGESSTTNSVGGTDTVQTVAARFSKAGLDYTESDVQAYYDANGKLPIDSKEMDEWDKKQYGVSYWDRIETDYPDGNLMNDNGRSTVSDSDIQKLIDAKTEGDARANSYFIDQQDLGRLNTASSRYMESQGRGFSEKTFSNISDEIRTSIKSNGGKIVVIGGNSYIIAGMSGNNSFGLYSPKTKQTKYYDIQDVIYKGLDTTIKLGQ
jgi:hypothetical protein